MSDSTSRIDPLDTVVLCVDLQAGIVELSRTMTLERLRKGVLGLAKLAKIFALPTLVSGVAAPDGGPPRMIPELRDGLGDYTVHPRTTADSFRNDAILTVMKTTARRTLLIAGVSSEVAVQLPALTAADLGLRVFVVTDACGGMSERTERAAFDRIAQAGGRPVSVMTLAGELAGEFTSPRAQAAIGVLYEMASA